MDFAARRGVPFILFATPGSDEVSLLLDGSIYYPLDIFFGSSLSEVGNIEA
jgi:hypothetical protein